jgi:PadR family transcriptional regulator PadR
MEWGVSETGRRVRTYRLTAKGRSRLAAERSKWEQLSDAIAGLLRPPEGSET